MMRALLHVSVPFLLCVAVANTDLFRDVQVDVTYEHYAEKPLDYMPAFLAMPFNCVVNLGYIFLGLYWLLRPGDVEGTDSRYMREVFGLMALFYGPVQWARLATLRRAPAVLDQWVTLPIFAWVPAWIDFIEYGEQRPQRTAALELFSVSSYFLALLHERGFDLALVCHVTAAVYKGLRAQLSRGDRSTGRYLLLATLACAGFVALKLLDHWLARFWLFQRLTGHFWSKVCDMLQFHFSFCFLTTLTRRKTAAQQE